MAKQDTDESLEVAAQDNESDEQPKPKKKKKGKKKAEKAPEPESTETESEESDGDKDVDTLDETDSPAVPQPESEIKSRGLPAPEQLLDDILDHRGWDIRDGQVQMVDYIADEVMQLDRGNPMGGSSINAPVGTGKTLGYLIGALPSDQRIVVCTSTKALQDQISQSELPKLKQDLKDLYDYDLNYSVMKGKSNYACPEAVQALLEGRFADEDEEALFGSLFDQMEDGDKVILNDILERIKEGVSKRDPSILDCNDLINTLPRGFQEAVRRHSCADKGLRWWRYVDEMGNEVDEPEDGENTNRQALPLSVIMDQLSCPFYLAQALALAADVLVMNTSLLAAELLKSRMGYMFIKLQIAGTGVIVVDEAHHLVRILTGALSIKVDMADVSGDIDTYAKRLIRYYPDSEDRLKKANLLVDNARGEIVTIATDNTIDESRKLASRRLWQLAEEMDQLMAVVTSTKLDAGNDGAKAAKAAARNVAEIENIVAEIRVAAASLNMKGEPDADDMVDYVYDVTYSEYLDDPDEMVIDLVPLDLTFFRNELGEVGLRPNVFLENSKEFVHTTKKVNSLILCSGTITEQTANTIGMFDAEHSDVDSPFKASNTRIFLPDDLPNPNNEDWEDAAWVYARNAIEAMGGRTLFLTTSHSRVNAFYDRLVREFELNGKFNVYRQDMPGFSSRGELLDTFANDENSVLIGTTSFWEGVDIPGRALSLVIIDKIPFPMMDDPIFKARMRHVERHGGHPFMEVQVDHASVMMAQGIGRLIRSETDRGGVLILDSRVSTARYGKKILSIVPDSTPVTYGERPFLEWLTWLADDNNIGERNMKMSRSDWEALVPKRRQRY